jgi:hypothetical protein
MNEQAVIHYRDQETMYINVMKDRVTVIFSTLFSDADDVVIGKVFMQVRARVARWCLVLLTCDMGARPSRMCEGATRKPHRCSFHTRTLQRNSQGLKHSAVITSAMLHSVWRLVPIVNIVD